MTHYWFYYDPIRIGLKVQTDPDGRRHTRYHQDKFKSIRIQTTLGGDESGVAISQIPDLLGLYSLIPDLLGLYSLIPDFLGLYSRIPDFRPLCPVPTFSRPIIMFYIFHMIVKIYINAYPPSHISIVANENIICQNFTASYDQEG